MEPYEITDAHVHWSPAIGYDELTEVLDETGTGRANLVLLPDREMLGFVPQAMVLKDRFPGRFYLFAGFDVSAYRCPDSLGEQMKQYIEEMRRCGCDGLKIIEGKPQFHRMYPVPDWDDPVWEPFWAYAEETALPILWHVNDPEAFWDSDNAPDFAREKGWVYDESDINNEVQYLQVLQVLTRHPQLKIIFAHFFFLSAQLPRLAAILDAFPHVMIDLTPGVEMYQNFSAAPAKARRFFRKYADRIIYGTDIGGRAVIAGGTKGLNRKECLQRAALVRAFLLEKEPLTVRADAYPTGIDDFVMIPLGLEAAEAQRIFSGNFRDFVGREPAAADAVGILRECGRLRLLLSASGHSSPSLQAAEEYFAGRSS